MAVTAPPSPPRRRAPGTDPDALIEEARALQRRRRRRRGALLAAALGVVAAVSISSLLGQPDNARSTANGAPRGTSSRTCPGSDLGTMAFIRGGALLALDLRTCTPRTLVRSGAAGPVQFSHDGRYVSFGGRYVATHGGPVRPGGSWSPAADVYLRSVGANGLALHVVGRGSRTLLPDGWGVHSTTFAPDGHTVAVSRSLYNGPTSKKPWHQEIWTIDLTTGAMRLLFREPPGALAPALLAGYSPDGRYLLFFEDLQNSASLAADGLPLKAVDTTTRAVHTIGKGTLLDRGFEEWCGGSLLYVNDNGGRQVTLGDGVSAVRPPSWKPTTILPEGTKTSWNTIACRPGGRSFAVTAGPTGPDTPFGHERRAIWLAPVAAGARPRRLTHPPTGQSDELPRWSSNGRWLTFVRTAPRGAGRLYALDVETNRLVGPITRFGSASNYYGTYSWASQTDWYR